MAGKSSAESGAADFKNVKEVLAHLKEQGRKVSQAKLYADVASHLLKKEKDGGFTHKAVNTYMKRHTASLDGQDDGRDQMRDKLLEQQARERAARASLAELDLAEREGLLISREEADQQMAMAVTVLKSGLKSFIMTDVLEIIHAAKGDPSTADAIIDLFMGKMNGFFNGFSRRREVVVANPDDQDFDDEEQDDVG